MPGVDDNDDDDDDRDDDRDDDDHEALKEEAKAVSVRATPTQSERKVSLRSRSTLRRPEPLPGRQGVRADTTSPPRRASRRASGSPKHRRGRSTNRPRGRTSTGENATNVDVSQLSKAQRARLRRQWVARLKQLRDKYVVGVCVARCLVRLVWRF